MVAPDGGPRWHRYLRFWRGSVQADIDAELRFHFDARIDELMEQGRSRDDAHRQALAEFGDVRDVRNGLREIDDRVARRRNRADWIDALRQDVVYAARSLRRTPVVSITIVLTLALGLGANAAMFSLLDAIFLRPPAGVANPEAVRRVWAMKKRTTGTSYRPNFNYMHYAALAESYAGQADVAVLTYPEPRKLARGEDARKASVSGASANLFATLGVKPAIGRFIAPDEDRLGAGALVAVVSDAFWRRTFGGRLTVLGQELHLDDQTFTIIGVAPPHFSGIDIETTDVWIPVATPAEPFRGTLPWWKNPDVNGFQIVFRLRAGAREGELEQRTTAVMQRPGIGYAWDSASVGKLGPIIASRGPGDLQPEVQVATRLGGVAIIVLLIACANVVNLLLARAVSRRREIAVRLALGISRARLIRLLVTESVLLSVIACVAALVAASWGGAAIRGLLLPDIHWAESPLHWRVLLFALLVAVAAGGAAGLIPALQAAAPDLTDALKAGSRAGSTHRSRLRASLVVAQSALSMLLLVGAALFVRSVHNIKAVDVGYAVDRVAFGSIRYEVPDKARDATIFDRILQLEPTVARIPGVEGVAFTSMRPRWGMTWIDFYPDADTTVHKKPDGFWTAVSPNFFAVTGTRLLRGQTFSAGAGAAEAPLEVIVNQTMADALWPGENPIGKCIRLRTATNPCTTVIGVAQTAMLNEVTEKASPRLYLPFGPAIPRRSSTTIVVRAAPERMNAVVGELRNVLGTTFPGAIRGVITMAATMEPEYRPWRLGATLFTLFGSLALLVAAIGIYSTVSYGVTQRAHEFGVRAALGASVADVLRQVLGEGLRTVAIGLLAGVVLAVAAGRLIESLLYGIKPSDPVVIASVGLVLLVIATIAAFAPAWRAARADPVTALRAD